MRWATLIAANAGRLVPDDLDATMAALEGAVQRNDEAAIMRTLQNLIPEFHPSPNGVVEPAQAEAMVVAVSAGVPSLQPGFTG